ncbi:MAG TPA: AMP-binding protein [Terriglobales bacterium]|nr:AMP-binding protein [Terriglobales bacterium]
MSSSLIDYLAHFSQYGNDAACVFPRGYRTVRWSYGELLGYAQRLATRIEFLGIGQGDRIMLWGANCGEWLAAFWGAMLRGVVVVPMDQAATPEFAARVFAQVGAKLLISSRELRIPSAPVTIHFEDLSQLSSAKPLDPVSLTRDDALEIVFTSGTTGEPKGVVITHGNVLANLEPIEREMQKYLRYERIFHPLRFLNLLPLSHVFGQFMGIFVPPLIGATTLFLESIKPSEIVRTIHNERVSVLITVPRLLGSLRELLEIEMTSRLGEERMRSEMERASSEHFGWRWWRFRRIHSRFGWKFWAIISGGATLDHDDEEFWRRLGFAVIQGYGLTETTSLVSLNHPFKLGRGSIGKALPGREIKLDDSGEILVRGDSIAKTYWVNGSPISAREGEWFRTGDLGAVDEAGNLYFKGRKKNVIVTAEGMNVYPEDLEAALKSDPAVRDCLVIGIEHGGNAEPCAVLVLNSREPHPPNTAASGAPNIVPVLNETSVSQSEPRVPHSARFSQGGVGAEASLLVTRANAKLAAHQQIRQWVVWPDEDFPRTSTQKPRQDLIAAYARAQIADSTTTARADAGLSGVEAAIASVTKRKIQSSAMAKLEDDLNLSSIDRVDLLTALEQRYQVELDETRFAEATTVSDLEQMLHEAAAVPPISHYRYPRWAQRWPITWIRTVIYYLLTWPATRIMARPEVIGREHLDNLKGPVLFVSNHVTYIDPGPLMFAMPRRVRHSLAIAMQGEMLAQMRNPPKSMNVFRRAVEQLSYWLVTALFDVFPLPQRSGFRDSFAFAGESVDHGYNVLIFAEGRRTTDGTMSPFRAGIGILAQQLRIPIVPMKIEGLFPLKQENRKFARRGEIQVIVGEPVEFAEDADAEEIARELENRVKNLSPRSHRDTEKVRSQIGSSQK